MKRALVVFFSLISAPAFSERILAQIEPTKDCREGDAQAWLSKERALYYHVEVPPQGEFEFHALPGKYNLVVTSSKGCFSESVVDLKVRGDRSLRIKLAKLPGGKS